MGLPVLQREACQVLVGLTDHPESRRAERGCPPDWRTYGPFHSEAAARRWERTMQTLPGYAAAGHGSGWRYGFTYSAPDGRPDPRAPTAS